MTVHMRCRLAVSIGCLLLVGSAAAAEVNFTFKSARRDVMTDPDGIWSGDAFAGGKASIFTYEIRSGTSSLIVSQIWNEDCSSSVCPTMLVRLEPGGRRIVLVDDMMHQVLPPNDPRFAGLPQSAEQAQYEHHPFRLSGDGKKLLNGDFSFDIGQSKP
ncbi:MAG: hypothetical protein ACTHP8_17070 [Bosea sp. (in: a-proteobacteria)]|uniref:hypothetical protein n=1 Tax=Bosea sp. (in: a-proteobacteria) TaxID=1871050 RepID=UPI003F7B4216